MHVRAVAARQVRGERRHAPARTFVHRGGGASVGWSVPLSVRFDLWISLRKMWIVNSENPTHNEAHPGMAFGIRGGVLLALLCVSLPLGVSATPTFTTERTLEEIPPSSMPGGVGSPVEDARLPLYRAHALAALDALNDARGNNEEVYTLGDVLEARTQVVAGELTPTIHQHPTIREKAPRVLTRLSLFQISQERWFTSSIRR